MDDVIALRRSNALINLLEDEYWLDLGALSRNEAPFTIEQFIAELEATTTLTNLSVCFADFKSTPENNRRFIEPLCRCIANLRRHNQDHPLSRLAMYNAHRNVNDVDQFLVAAKQFGIHHMECNHSRLPVQSLVEFCRGNTHLKVLHFIHTNFSDKDSTISVSPQDGPQDSSVITALDELTVTEVMFEYPTTESAFLNFIARVTYPSLALGRFSIFDHDVDERKIARLRIVSELIKPSVEQLTLRGRCCRIEVMDVIEACPTVTQIQLINNNPTSDFHLDEVQQKLQAIVTRNRELARFVANPREYPRGDALVALMSQFDNSPTGRYMLARCFPGMDSFFKIKSTDSSSTGPKKKRRRC